MNAKIIWAIVKKDWLEVSQNTSAIGSMLIVPLMFTVVLPLIMFLAVGAAGPGSREMARQLEELRPLLANMPAGMLAYLAPWNEFQQVFVLMLGIMFAPMFLILPLMSAVVIAAESFVGERERKTMEALLYTAASDAELFTGKVLAAFIPSLALTWVSFGLYTLVANLAGWNIFGQVWFPLPMWWPLIFWVTPAIAALAIALTVLISAKMHTFMEAYQTGAASVILVLGLMVGQVTGVLYLSVGMALLTGLVFWLAAGVLAWFGIRIFNRTALLMN